MFVITLLKANVVSVLKGPIDISPLPPAALNITFVLSGELRTTSLVLVSVPQTKIWEYVLPLADIIMTSLTRDSILSFDIYLGWVMFHWNWLFVHNFTFVLQHQNLFFTVFQPGYTVVQPGLTLLQPSFTVLQPGCSFLKPGLTVLKYGFHRSNFFCHDSKFFQEIINVRMAHLCSSSIFTITLWQTQATEQKNKP